MTPKSQKAADRPIGFLLMDNARGTVLAQMSLIIRPEELTRDDPARSNVQQTLGGAWADVFGAGVSAITLNGHTGWRGGHAQDGAEIFRDLYDTVWTRWFAEREAHIQRGDDPDDVELVFADTLDRIAVVVLPMRFQLRRHKSRPLLSMFHIQMQVLAELSDPGRYAMLLDQIAQAVNNPYGRYRAAHDSMAANIGRQANLADRIGGLLGGSLGLASRSFLQASNTMLAAVLDVARQAAGSFDAVTAPLLATSIQMQQAGRNAFQMLAMPSSLESDAKQAIMQISGNCNDAYCNLMNGFNLLRQFPDFSDLFGASTCSSTGGGRPISPLAGDNPFLEIYQPQASPVRVSAPANAAMTNLRGDPLTSAMNQADIQGALHEIAQGVTLA